MNRLRKVGAVDIRYKTKCHASIRVVLQRLVGHYWAQIRAADADIDYVTNTLAGVPLPFSVSQPVCEIRHPVEYGMHLGDHVFAIHDDGRLSRCSQGGMQNRSFLGEVNLLPVKHGVDSFPQSRFLGEFDQQLECLVRDAILRVIEIKAQGFHSQTRPPLGIVRKELSQVYFPDLLIVGPEVLPCLALDRWAPGYCFRACCHVRRPFVYFLYLKPIL